MRLGQRPINSRIIEGVWGFLGAYVVIFILTFLALNLQGLDTKTAFSAVVACINNLGPGLGAVSNDYSMLNDVSKMILCLAMLLGRLEIFYSLSCAFSSLLENIVCILCSMSQKYLKHWQHHPVVR